mgnify:FL=1
MDKIKRAIEQGELADFLIGKGEYKYWNRELRDPQDWSYCWQIAIVPFAKEYKDLPNMLVAAFEELLQRQNDVVLNIYTVTCNVSCYYYLLDKNRVDFKIDFSDVERHLVDKINLHRNELLECKKWAGAEIYSHNGLIQPLERTIARSKELGGFVGIDVG